VLLKLVSKKTRRNVKKKRKKRERTNDINMYVQGKHSICTIIIIEISFGSNIGFDPNIECRANKIMIE
jgi:hypothetical protein